ncbi:MAG: ZIP family metal transporter [candidate division KSB1 bacterium]|nr:ZIP family metal transporter [candidate division KSB1 bacterium]
MSRAAFFVYIGAIFGIAVGGGFIPMLWQRNQYGLRLSVSFGAGVLLGAAFLHMLPEAAELTGSSVGVGILAGFLLMYVTEKFVMTHPCDAEHCDYHRVGWAAFGGLTLHSLVDGVALGSGALVPAIGPSVALAILFHKLPASVALSSVLLRSGFSRLKTQLAVTAFGAGVPIGAILTRWALAGLPPSALGALVAFSAGTFIHIATDDLMPEIHRVQEGRFVNLLAFAAGLGFVFAGKSFSA